MMNDLFPAPKKNTKKSVREILLRVASADAVDGFVEMRWLIKAPMTDRAAGLIAEKLVGRMNADQILDLSTENNWKSVFPDSQQLNGGHNGQRTHNGNNNADATTRAHHAAARIDRSSQPDNW